MFYTAYHKIAGIRYFEVKFRAKLHEKKLEKVLKINDLICIYQKKAVSLYRLKKKTKGGLTYIPTPDADEHRCNISRVGDAAQKPCGAHPLTRLESQKKVPEKAWAYYALPASDKEKSQHTPSRRTLGII